MLMIDGYNIEHYPKDNKIIIGLPQTMLTCTNTVSPISNRRIDINDNELSAILYLTKTYFEQKTGAQSPSSMK